MKTQETCVGAVISERRLRRLFDRYAGHVLHETGFVETSYGADGCEHCTVIGLLPTKEEYVRLRDRMYTMTMEQVIDVALNIFEELANEMSDWFEGMPENLQFTQKAETIQQTAETLGSITSPSVPASLKGLTIVHLPEAVCSRAERNGQAISILQKVVDRLDELDAEGAAGFAGELEDIIATAEEAEFPGMYG